MATRPPIIRHQATSSLFLLGATSLLDNYFASASILPVSAVAPVARNEAVAQHTRRRYPGDVGHGVSAHARSTTTEVGRAGSPAQPGKRFWCERPSGEGPLRKSNAVQFSYLGSWKDLKAFARAQGIGANFILRNSSGRSVVIET
jgi:hypothetical protein